MTRARKGHWTSAEDQLLIGYVTTHGEKNWDSVQQHTGLSQSGHSCRLRWLSNLKPDLSKTPFTEEEEQFVIQLHASLGNKWSLIAKQVCQNSLLFLKFLNSVFFLQLHGELDHDIRTLWHAKIKNMQPAELPINATAQQSRQNAESLDHGPDVGINYLQRNQRYSYLASMDRLFSSLIKSPSMPSRKRTREPDDAFPYMDGYAMNKNLKLPSLQSFESHEVPAGYWRPQLESYNSLFQAHPTGLTPSDYKSLESIVYGSSEERHNDQPSLVGHTELLQSSLIANAAYSSPYEPHLVAEKLELPSVQQRFDSHGVSGSSGTQLFNPMPTRESYNALFQTPPTDQTPLEYGLLQPVMYGSSGERQTRQSFNFETDLYQFDTTCMDESLTPAEIDRIIRESLSNLLDL